MASIIARERVPEYGAQGLHTASLCVAAGEELSSGILFSAFIVERFNATADRSIAWPPFPPPLGWQSVTN